MSGLSRVYLWCVGRIILCVGINDLANWDFRVYIYLFLSLIFLALSWVRPSKLLLIFEISIFSLLMMRISSVGTYIQLYCLTKNNFLCFNFWNPLFESFYWEMLLVWKSVLLIFNMQFEHNWLWNRPEAMILYLVSTSLKFDPAFIFIFRRN